MKKTANYDLNQWEKSDRIMMDDFNADNAKIDAAISSEANRVADLPHGELICGGITETAVEEVRLDVSAVDWSRYWEAVLEIRTPSKCNLWLYPCTVSGYGQSSHAYMGSNGTNGSLGFMGYRDNTVNYITISVLYSGDHPFTTCNGSLSGVFGTSYTTLDNVAYFLLRVYASQEAPLIPEGTIVRLWGVR